LKRKLAIAFDIFVRQIFAQTEKIGQRAQNCRSGRHALAAKGGAQRGAGSGCRGSIDRFHLRRPQKLKR
jgi:hypothetical protein